MRYRLRWRDSRSIVETDEPEIVADIERLLALRAEPAHDGDDNDAPLAVRHEGSAYALASPYGSRQGLARAELLYVLLEMIGHDLMEKSNAAIIHAGAFLAEGGARVYFGQPLAGKSSLTFAAWRRGFAVVGDDRAALDAERREVRVFPKCVKLRVSGDAPDALGRLGLPRGQAFLARADRETRAVLARSLPGMAPSGAAFPIAALCWLSREASVGAALEPLAPSAALPLILGQVVPPDPAPMALVRLIKAMAARERLFALKLGRDAFEDALDLLAGL